MARVGYVSRTSGVHDRRWVRTLRDGGHEVTALVRSSQARRQPRETPTLVWEDDQHQLRGLVENLSLDILVAGPLTDAAAAAIEADVAPTLCLSWAFDLLVEMERDPAVAGRVRRTLPRAAWVHVDCADLARRVHDLGVPRGRISVAAWGIDTSLFSPGDRLQRLAEVGDSQRARVVFSARAMEPMYDVPTVLRGFALAHREDPSLRLTLGGTGSEGEAIERLTRDLALGSVVHRVGHMSRTELRDRLRESDVYLSASRSDGTSLSLVEALAVGVPAVVSDLESNREWVSSPTYGQLFPVGHPDELAQVMLEQLGVVETPELVNERRKLVMAQGVWSKNRQVFLHAVDRVLEQE